MDGELWNGAMGQLVLRIELTFPHIAATFRGRSNCGETAICTPNPPKPRTMVPFLLVVFVLTAAGAYTAIGTPLAESSIEQTDARQAKQQAEAAADNDCRVKISSRKGPFRILEPIEISVQIENHRPDSVYFRTSSLFNRFSYRLIDSEGNRVPTTRYGSPNKDGSSGSKRIAKGAAFEDRIQLTRGFDLSVSGKYKLAVGASLSALPDAFGFVWSGFAWSNELELEIEDVAVKQPRMPDATWLKSSANLQEYRLTVSMPTREFRPLEPIEMHLQLQNVSSAATNAESKDGLPPVTYASEVWLVNRFAEKPNRRKAVLTRHGRSHQWCKHPATRPLAPGESHEDSILLNHSYDLDEAEVEIHITASIPRGDSEGSAVRLTVGPIRLVVQGEAWWPKSVGDDKE